MSSLPPTIATARPSTIYLPHLSCEALASEGRAILYRSRSVASAVAVSLGAKFQVFTVQVSRRPIYLVTLI